MRKFPQYLAKFPVIFNFLFVICSLDLKAHNFPVNDKFSSLFFFVLLNIICVFKIWVKFLKKLFKKMFNFQKLLFFQTIFPKTTHFSYFPSKNIYFNS